MAASTLHLLAVGSFVVSPARPKWTTSPHSTPMTNSPGMAAGNAAITDQLGRLIRSAADHVAKWSPNNSPSGNEGAFAHTGYGEKALMLGSERAQDTFMTQGAAQRGGGRSDMHPPLHEHDRSRSPGLQKNVLEFPYTKSTYTSRTAHPSMQYRGANRQSPYNSGGRYSQYLGSPQHSPYNTGGRYSQYPGSPQHSPYNTGGRYSQYPGSPQHSPYNAGGRYAQYPGRSPRYSPFRSSGYSNRPMGPTNQYPGSPGNSPYDGGRYAQYAGRSPRYSRRQSPYTNSPMGPTPQHRGSYDNGRYASRANRAARDAWLHAGQGMPSTQYSGSPGNSPYSNGAYGYRAARAQNTGLPRNSQYNNGGYGNPQGSPHSQYPGSPQQPQFNNGGYGNPQGNPHSQYPGSPQQPQYNNGGYGNPQGNPHSQYPGSSQQPQYNNGGYGNPQGGATSQYPGAPQQPQFNNGGGYGPPEFGAESPMPGREKEYASVMAQGGAQFAGPSSPPPPIDNERQNRSPGISRNFFDTPTSDFKRPYTGRR